MVHQGAVGRFTRNHLSAKSEVGLGMRHQRVQQ